MKAEGGWGSLGCGGGRGIVVAVVGDALGWRNSFLFFCLWALRLFFLLSSLRVGDDLGDAKPLGGVAHLGSPLPSPLLSSSLLFSPPLLFFSPVHSTVVHRSGSCSFLQ